MPSFQSQSLMFSQPFILAWYLAVVNIVLFHPNPVLAFFIKLWECWWLMTWLSLSSGVILDRRKTAGPRACSCPGGSLHTMTSQSEGKSSGFYVLVGVNSEGRSWFPIGPVAWLLNLSLYPLLLLSVSHRCWPWEHSPINFLHTDLLFGVCFSWNPTCSTVSHLWLP